MPVSPQPPATLGTYRNNLPPCVSPPSLLLPSSAGQPGVSSGAAPPLFSSLPPARRLLIAASPVQTSVCVCGSPSPSFLLLLPPPTYPQQTNSADSRLGTNPRSRITWSSALQPCRANERGVLQVFSCLALSACWLLPCSLCMLLSSSPSTIHHPPATSPSTCHHSSHLRRVLSSCTHHQQPSRPSAGGVPWSSIRRPP